MQCGVYRLAYAAIVKCKEVLGVGYKEGISLNFKP